MATPEYIHHSGWPWPLDGVQDFFEDLWDTITGVASAAAELVWSTIPEPLKNFIDFLGDLTSELWNKFLDFLADPIGSIKEGFDWILTGVTNLVGWWDPEQNRFVGGFLGWLWDSITSISAWISDGLSWVWDQISPALDAVKNKLFEIAGEVSAAVGGVVDWIGSTVWGWIDGALRWASDAFTWLKGEITAGVEWFADSVGTAFDGAATAIGDALTSLFTDPLGAIGGFFESFLGGFGVIDITGHAGAITGIFDSMSATYAAALEKHSPLTPAEAFSDTSDWKSEQRDYWYQLYITALAVEGFSLGQIETPNMMLMSDPEVKASMALATEWYATPYKVGHTVRLEQFWRSIYTPELPPVADLIRFVVREVITPARFNEIMPFQGFDEEWAGAYWEAHWVLPAPVTLYDAFHRGAITAEELDKFIVWHDYKPEPRPGISKSDVEIMRSVLKRLIPRVDLRYAWEMGRLSDEELLKRFEWLGYEDDAPLMTDIQKLRALVEEVHKVRDEWIRDAVAGWITLEQLGANLSAIGIGPARVEYYIEYSRKRREREHKEELLDLLGDGYVKDLLTDEALEEAAKTIIVDPESLELYLERRYFEKFHAFRGASAG